jgi:membrane protein
MANNTHTAPDEVGRYAESVFQIPRKGWKEILSRAAAEVGRDNLSLVAGGAAFFLLLAIFPALAAFVALYGLLFDPAQVESQIAALQGLMPGAATDILQGELERLTATDSASLSFGFVFGLLVSLWSANAGVKSLFAAMNIVYDEDEKRGFVALTLRSFAFTLAAIVGAVVLLTAIVVVPAVLGSLGLGQAAETAIDILRWPILLLVLTFGIGALFKFGASRRPPRWRWISWGTGLTAVLWVVVSAAFSFYLSNFANYNATYGSLGAVIGFMMWLYISLMILFVGAELNAEIERQVATDTTVGPPKPMGQREANHADHLPDDAGVSR